MKPFIAGHEFVEPDEVIELADGDEIDQAGIDVRRGPHARAHAGSVVFRTRRAPRSGPVELALTGDTLFQGSIGRSDLPGGNHEQLARIRSPASCWSSATTPWSCPGTVDQLDRRRSEARTRSSLDCSAHAIRKSTSRE